MARLVFCVSGTQIVPMLDEFIASNRDAIIDHAKCRVAQRRDGLGDVERPNGIPIFLDQLGDALRLARSSDRVDHVALSKSAGLHGGDLLRMGLTIRQVVHDYGDVCQAITTLAMRQGAQIRAEDFQTLNLCLDDAIAEAVTTFARVREREIADQGTERLGVLAHELRNLLNVAVLSFDSIKSGRVPAGGSTGVVLGRSLMDLRELIDLSLADVRLDAGIERLGPISVAQFVEEVEVGALIQAQARQLQFVVMRVDPTLTIEGDRQILAAVLSNLLQNAFKFTPKNGKVSLSIQATADRILFDVEDECGGLPPGKSEELFRPYEQRGDDRTGMGLGLSISLKAAKANHGELRVRNLAGKGCVFTLDLPKKRPPPLTMVVKDQRNDRPSGGLAGAKAMGGRPPPARSIRPVP